jgi:prepilin-type processing-associated H-X9-DG protein
MVEDWYYIQPGARFVQFRHLGRANVLFADWHVEAVGPAAGSFDPRLPEARIGYFDSKDVVFAPGGSP